MIIWKKSHGMTLFYEESKNKFKHELELILSRNKLIPDIGQRYCSCCDPRYNLLNSPEKNLNDVLLDSQVNFRSDINRIEFKRSFKENFKILNSFRKESMASTTRIGIKLSKYPNIIQELDYLLALDAGKGKLSFTTQYKEKNHID